jgi:plastocyanin
MNENTNTPEITQETQLKVGDKVEWMHCSSNGHRMRFSSREGKIEVLNPHYAQVKTRNGRKYWVAIKDLTLPGQKNGVTKLFEELAGVKIGGAE